jgi:hypothetical protein
MPPDAARRVGMLKEIERFNMHHHEIYAVFKGALGARAKNTVVNIIKKLDGAILVFAALAPDDAGHFPAGELYERLKEQQRDEGRRRLDSLLLAEGKFLEQFLDRRGTERLSALLSRISGKAKDDVTEDVEAETVGPTR